MVLIIELSYDAISFWAELDVLFTVFVTIGVYIPRINPKYKVDTEYIR